MATDAELLVARARFVADHWRVAILAGDVTGTQAWAAHPLCMVLAALDGETDPVQCGISADARDAWPRADPNRPPVPTSPAPPPAELPQPGVSTMDLLE